MAYNEIQVGRFLRYFQKLFSMKGTEPREITLAPEIMPGLLIAAGGPEDWYLQSWAPFGVAMRSPAVVAQVANAKIRNPAGSNIIALVSRAHANVLATDQILWSYRAQTADFASLAAAQTLDPRGRVSGGSTVVASFGSGQDLSLGVPIYRSQVLANTITELIWDDSQSFPLLPGFELIAGNETVNTVLDTGWRWRERFLEESERT